MKVNFQYEFFFQNKPAPELYFLLFPLIQPKSTAKGQKSQNISRTF